ncbi:hypothetical protein DYB32_003556 [Aphanomyces invadans]|uniref:Uncharacterized protein n=1 Tax=Aphanomyces invadans TaxID=157072 RepID=A0A3R6YB68_9STRA|nr:hypothetical protein DYB32_003556 [Aphanomyces invadans]
MGVSLVSKRFLNVWNFIVLILGFALLLITLYILLFQSDTYAIPKVGYWSSIVCSGLLILLAALGLYGLRQQRLCVTRNKRNYALGIYCLCGFITGVVLVMAGSMALKFNMVINDSKALEFAQTAEVYLEEAIVDNLNDYASTDPAKWRKTQDSWFCCGYFDLSRVQKYVCLLIVPLRHRVWLLLGFALGIFLLLCDVRMMRLGTMQPHALEQAIKEAQT